MATATKPETRPQYKQIKACRACGSGQWENILSLGDQYLVNFIRQKDVTLPRAPLELIQCAECGLLQLKHTVHPDLLFRDFWYRTGINQTMRGAMVDLVRHALRYHGEGTWVDIGANDGYLLSQVPHEFEKVAFEPALNMASDIEEHADIAISDYFSAKPLKRESCHVITSAACFYDVDDPNEFVADIAEVLTPDGIWINQLNDAPTMMRQNAWDAICHEHLAYYDVATLQRLYERHGLHIVSINHNDVNGGSVRVVASKRSAGWVEQPMSVRPAEAHGFAHRVRKWKQLMTWHLDACVASGRKVWGYGASTKGSVLLQYLNHNHGIEAIADRNPRKVGMVMAGTWLPISDEETMRRAAPEILLVLPWAFKQEFVEREKELRRGHAAMLFPLPNPEYIL